MKKYSIGLFGLAAVFASLPLWCTENPGATAVAPAIEAISNASHEKPALEKCVLVQSSGMLRASRKILPGEHVVISVQILGEFLKQKGICAKIQKDDGQAFCVKISSDEEESVAACRVRDVGMEQNDGAGLVLAYISRGLLFNHNLQAPFVAQRSALPVGSYDLSQCRHEFNAEKGKLKVFVPYKKEK